jgi:hypothetical protein
MMDAKAKNGDLTSSTAITIDPRKALHFNVTLDHNTTLSMQALSATADSSKEGMSERDYIDGSKRTVNIIQGTTGGTVAHATSAGNFKFGADITSFTASVGSGKRDRVTYQYCKASNIWDIIDVKKGF